MSGLKRAFDVAGSLVLLAALGPFLAAAAVAVALDGPGPVLFRQRRLGLRSLHPCRYNPSPSWSLRPRQSFRMHSCNCSPSQLLRFQKQSLSRLRSLCWRQYPCPRPRRKKTTNCSTSSWRKHARW